MHGLCMAFGAAVLLAGVAAAIPDTVPFSASPHQLSPSTVGLRILIGFVNDPHCISENSGDPRYKVLVPLAAELTRRGHTVLWRSEPGQEELLLGHGSLGGIVGSTYEHYDPATATTSGIDVAILWGAEETEVPLPPTTKRLFYENGYTDGAVTVDPSGLLGNSFYTPSLNTECRNTGMDETTCVSFVANHLSSALSGFSMRETDVDPSILGRFLLVPTQKQLTRGAEGGALEAVRGERFIEGRGPALPVTLPELLKETIRFGKAEGIPVVVQVDEGAEQMQMARALADEYDYRDGVHFSNSSMNVLTKEALFTVTINGDSIMDNFITGTPVLTCGPSMWMETDGVLHDSNLARGLHAMAGLVANAGWSDERVERQRQAVCWYESHSMNVGNTPDENIAILQAHLDAIERLRGRVVL